jgi:hypothetical protein
MEKVFDKLPLGNNEFAELDFWLWGWGFESSQQLLSGSGKMVDRKK